MEQNQQTDQTQTANVFMPPTDGGNRYYWWGGIFLIILALGALVAFTFSLTSWNQNDETGNYKEQVKVSGQLAITGINKNNEDSSLATYSLDFNYDPPRLKNQTERMGLFTSSFLEFIDRRAPGGIFFKTFVPVSTENNELVEEVVNAAYRYDHDTNQVSEIFTDLKQEIGTMSVSEAAGLLAYSQLSDEGQKDFSAISNWQVVISSLDGKQIARIDSAAHPAWLLDGSQLLYLKQGGLYTLDWLTKEETLMYSISNERADFELTISTMFDITETGEYIVILPQGSGKIYVLRVDWSAQQAEVVSLVDSDEAMFSWPVTSPNNNSYAVIASLIDTETDNLYQPRIEIRSFTDERPLATFPLTDFDVESIFLDDWVDISSGR